MYNVPHPSFSLHSLCSNYIQNLNKGFVRKRSYEVDGINCVIHPKYLTMSAFGEHCPDIFYAHLHQLFHYNLSQDIAGELPVKKRFEFHPRPYRLYDIESRVLQEHTGLELLRENRPINFTNYVKEFLNKGCPVFIPINKKYLAHYDSYKIRNSQGILGIIGYDKIGDRFLVRDSEMLLYLANTYEKTVNQKEEASDIFFPATCFDRFILSEDLHKAALMYDNVYSDFQTQIVSLVPSEKNNMENVENTLHTIAERFTLHSDDLEILLEPKFQWLEKDDHADIRSGVIYLASQRNLGFAIGDILRTLNKNAEAKQMECSIVKIAKLWEMYRLELSLNKKRTNTIAESKIKKNIIQEEKIFIDRLIEIAGLGKTQRVNKPNFKSFHDKKNDHDNSSPWLHKKVADNYFKGFRKHLPFAKEHLEIMKHVLYHNNSHFEPRIIYDLGAGDGALGVYFAHLFPQAHICFIDFSITMIERLKELKQVLPSSQYTIVKADLAQKDWHSKVKQVLGKSVSDTDLIVSGFCIHHLKDDRKYHLYKEIYNILSHKGWFLNLEHIASRSAFGEVVFEEAMVDALMSYKQYKPEERLNIRKEFQSRDDKSANILAPLETQLYFLEEIGFQNVECFFQWFELALFGGQKI